MTTLKMHTPNLVDSNIERLAELFPNCVTEKPKTDEQGKVIRDMNGEVVLERGIDFELLKQELSHSVIDGSQERYRLDWVGKRDAIVTANSPIAKTLRPCRDESVDFETTGNLFIEGDNLEALKLLQESYLGKVKMIYIDPPYNTGNDFIYNDDFAADTQAFFERSGQVDADGNRLVANTERNGRFHSDWLSMMYSRLKLARNLLADDGVIFISIDDNEQANLKKICDEVFGSSNFVSDIVWQKKTGASDAKKIATITETILVYQKGNKFEANKNKSSYDFNRYRLQDEYINTRGNYYIDNLDRGGLQYSDSLNFGIECPDGTLAYPNGRKEKTEEGWIWKWSKSKIEWARENGFLEFRKSDQKECGWSVCYKNYLYVDNENNLVERSAPYKNLITDILNTNSNKEIKQIFDDKKFFDFPKPIGLIDYFLKIGADKNALILDFFAGSSTTAHAVMQLNAEDGGNRQFIMVQIPEATDSKSEAFKAGYPTIAEISKERIRRAGQKIKSDNADKEGINELDTGFRVLKIDTTNMNDIYYRPQDYSQDLLHQLENNIKADRSDEDLLFQFMLDTGVPLSLPIERTELSSKSGGHTIYQVGGNSLIASLDYIDANMVNDIAALNPLKFITSERAIATDSDKTNIKERFKQLSPHTDVRFI